MRAGEIKTIFHRVEVKGSLQVVGNAGPTADHEDGTKVNKITICNVNSCPQGILLTVAFIKGSLANSTSLVPINDGFYVYYRKPLAIGETLIMDRHYFDRAFSYVIGKSANTIEEEDLQIAFRVDLPADGSGCTVRNTNPGIDVHITK
tara:strand:+ start:130 stop:573 length:444 start_codon:yes stop_codon:yes gene_type:complete